MKILYVGEHEGNTGPANVNRAIAASWPPEDMVTHLACGSKSAQVVEGVWKGLGCDVILFSNNSMVDAAIHAFFRMLRKPCVCFNHGYLPVESRINGVGISNRRLDAFSRHMLSADAIVANSELQMRLLERELEPYSGILAFTNLGVEPFDQAPTVRANPRPVIAVSGGTRPIKANEVVLRAIRILRSRGIDCELRVYGRGYAENEELSAAFRSGEAAFMGQVPQDEFVRQLREADVFVMNSRHESFGLSALDAVKAGCSLLLSRNCGVNGVLALEDDDVVEDCEDAAEVADRIEGLLAHPNAKRLYDALDFDALSWKRTARKLRSVCVRVAK